MPLNDEQRALLRLLMSGEDYESVGSLLGTGAGEVRERARDAITALASADPESRAAGLTDFLVGQADAGTAERISRALADSGDARALVAEIDAALIAEGVPRSRPEPVRSAAALPGASGAGSRRRIWIALAVAAVAVAAIVLIAGGFLEEDSAPPDRGREDISEDVVETELVAPGDSQAEGRARLVRIEDRPVLELDLRGLRPTSSRQVYVVWLLAGEDAAFPVAFQAVGESGAFQGQVPIASAAISILPNVDALDISLAETARVRAEIREATAADRLPRRVGTSVLRGSLR